MHSINSAVAITHQMTLCKFSAVLHVSWPVYKFYRYILLRLLHNLYSRMEWSGNLQVHKPVCLVTWQLLAVSWRWGHKIFPLTQRSHTQCDKQDNCWICLLSEKEQANLSVPCILTAVKGFIDGMIFCTASKSKKLFPTKHNLLSFPFLCVHLRKRKQPESMDCHTRLSEQASFSPSTQTWLQFPCTESASTESEISLQFWIAEILSWIPFYVAWFSKQYQRECVC